MKNYKEIRLSRLGIYGVVIYTMYKSGLITEDQIFKLNQIPVTPNKITDVFDIIDKVFEDQNNQDALDNFRNFTGM